MNSNNCSMNRKEGYYWILLSEEWEVAYYDKDGWSSIWDGGAYQDDELKEIDERIIIKL